MEFTLAYRHHPQPLSLITRLPRPSFISVEFSKAASFSSITPKASFRNPNYETPRHPITKPLVNPTRLSLLKTTLVTGVTVAAIFLSLFSVEPAIVAPPLAIMDETQEEEYHIKALKTLMENKIKSGKSQEAVGILDRLINIDDNQELKDYLHSAKGPLQLRVEANYVHAKEWFKKLEKETHERMEVSFRCRKMEHYRDCKLMLAQIRLTQGHYNDALKIYQELSEEQPKDLKPYFIQGIIHTLLGKNDDAEYSFGIVEKIMSGRLWVTTDYMELAMAILYLGFLLAILYEVQFKM